MDWSVKIFSYCERGSNPAFWAEPFNAITNAAFIFASLAALVVWTRQPSAKRGLTELALIALVAIIGVGSFLFHTYATRWSAIADTAPIGLFMFVYTGYALRLFVRLPWIAAALGVALFGWLLNTAFNMPCPVALRGLVSGHRCLNGSIGYLPALAMLGSVGVLASLRRHPAAPWLLASTVLLALSLTARTVDLEVCSATRVWGQLRGTHAIWHLLNAAMLGLLLLAAVRHGRPTNGDAPP